MLPRKLLDKDPRDSFYGMEENAETQFNQEFITFRLQFYTGRHDSHWFQFGLMFSNRKLL